MKVPELVLNDRECFTIGEDDEHLHDLVPMLSNHRLVMTPKDSPYEWDWGWCFRSAQAALLAYIAWDPATQDEPPGWHKRPTYDRIRQAPRRDEDPMYNWARCEHGHYFEYRGCSHIGCAAWKPQESH